MFRHLIIPWLLASGAAPAAEPLRYTLRFPAPHTHFVEVEAAVPADGRREVELLMPVWTPGSYLVREYSRNVEGFTARSAEGRELTWRKVRKNRWRVDTAGSGEIHLRYRVYARQMVVQANWVERDFALLNGAATFLTLADSPARPHAVAVELPAGWSATYTGLAPVAGRPHHYLAPDFDTLVDCPLVAGNPAVHEFTVDGKRHRLVNEGEGGVWDGPRSAADVERIVREYRRLWGSLPYDQYLFFNLLTQAGGGLEHRNSTVMMASRWATRTRAAYLRWLGLVSHEYFHAWNVKRLRPAELGPFDYENENYTPSLWVAEGFTTYYGPLALRRAGLSTAEEYLGGLARQIEQLETTPGRQSQPLAAASFDAWIRHYRPDENSGNAAISYYTKGAVVAFLLDAHMRRRSANARSLDDVMRLAYARYSGTRGYTAEDFQRTIGEVAGEDVSAWWRRHIESTEDVSYDEALAWYGLRLHGPGRSTNRAWLGMETRADGGRLIVARVPRGTPAYEAGFNVDDEILAVDDYRVRPDQWETRLGEIRPTVAVRVLVARRERLLTLPVTPGREPERNWRLEPDPQATPARRENRRRWLEVN